MVKVLAVDRNSSFLETQKLIWPSLEILGSAASNLESARSEYERFRPDIVMIELELAQTDGFETVKSWIEHRPNLTIVAVHRHAEISVVRDAFRLGIWDLAFESEGVTSSLKSAIERVSRTESERETRSEERSKQLGRISELNGKVNALEEEIQTLRSRVQTDESFLAEIHHRVKNNLQIILILLELQSESTKNSEARQILIESQNRIFSMALLQEDFYSKMGTKATIDAQYYISHVAYHLVESFGKTNRIELIFTFEEIELEANRAFTLGLLVNEILAAIVLLGDSNSEQAKIELSLKEFESGELELKINENLNAFSRWNPGPDSPYEGNTLIKMLVSQADGRVVDSESPNGELRLQLWPPTICL